jgi:hypothetical protein
MILFNKLVRTDILLLLALLLIVILRNGFWQSFFEGIAAVSFLISLINHIEWFRKTKKIY